jgi:hypothetical protein
MVGPMICVGPRLSEHRDEAFEAGVMSSESVVVDQVLINRNGVTATAGGLFNHLAVRRRGARARRRGFGGHPFVIAGFAVAFRSSESFYRRAGWFADGRKPTAKYGSRCRASGG